MPPTGCVGPERVVRAHQVSFFFSIFFFYSNYTHSLRMSPTCHILHPYGTHRLRRARTRRSGPTGGFFFFFFFFFVLTTPRAYGCHPRHQHAIYSPQTAPTGCIDEFFFFYCFFFILRSSNSNS